FGVGHVAGLELFNLLVNGVAHLGGRMAGEGNRTEDEKAGIFVARSRALANGFGGDLLRLDEAAIKARDAAIGENVGDRVINSVIGVTITGPVIALDIDGL